MITADLTLDDDDSRVIAALNAEQRLFDFYRIQAKTHFFRLPGLGYRIRVSEIGEGEPVLIVPGNTGDSFPLVPLMAELKGRRIIALNRPGGGLSEGIDHAEVDFRQLAVQTIKAAMDFFGLKRVPLIGHSIGGQWCLWMAMDKPERVTALTLLGVPGNIMGSGPPLPMRLLSVPVINKWLLSLITPKHPDPALKGLAFMGHSAIALAKLPPAISDCYFHFQKLPHYRLSLLSLMSRGNLLGASAADRINAEQLENIEQPTLMLWGTNDPFGKIEKGREIAGTLPSAQFEAITDGGHLPWLDDPGLCGRLIMDFWQNIERPGVN